MKLTFSSQILISLCLFTSVNIVYAENLSYNYVEGGMNYYLGDGSDISSFKLDGSLDITENINFIAGIESNSVSIEGYDIKLNEYTLGAGLHTSVNLTTDFITEMSLINAELSSPWYNLSSNAVMAGVGVRKRLTDKLEGHAKLNTYKALESETDAGAELILGGRLHINEQISGGLDYTQPDSGADGVLTTSIRLQSL